MSHVVMWGMVEFKINHVKLFNAKTERGKVFVCEPLCCLICAWH